jgi:hypothetical protein
VLFFSIHPVSQSFTLEIFRSSGLDLEKLR